MKKQLLILTAVFLKALFIPQFASGQSSRIWGTYYGQGAEVWSSTTTDAAGNVYLAATSVGTLGLASGGFQNVPGGGRDAILVKFDANGNRLWATYYGGSGEEYGNSVATDAAGNVYLAGVTYSTSNIASGGFQNTLGFQDTLGDQVNAFLVKFDANGNRLWATYYGGALGTSGNGVTTDVAGNVYLAGNTQDTTGIAAAGFQNTFGGGNLYGFGDAFLVKFDANGNRLWATYYGGPNDDGGFSITTDTSGNIFLAGLSSSTSGIASGGFLDTLPGANRNTFLVKFDANGNRLWATYYNGTNGNGVSKWGVGLAVDVSGNVYIAGGTKDTTGIASGGFQNTFGGGGSYGDAFLVKFGSGGNRLWATYYGGTGDESAWSVATDVAGNVFLSGTTNSTQSIASGGFQDAFIGDTMQDIDMFLVKFDARGNRECATYFGKRTKEIVPTSIALDKAGNVYATASADDSTANIASGGFQNTFISSGPGTGTDLTLIKFISCHSTIQSSDTTFCAPACINYTDPYTNATSWQWNFPGGTPSSSTIQNPQGICYNAQGNYDVKLIASNGSGSDTLTYSNFIKAFLSPPTPRITQSYDTLYCTTDPSYTSYQWYDSTTLIPGATDTFLVVTHGGNYNVAVTNEFGCKISVGITIANNVGINEFSANNFISLSPNPASTQLTIHTLFSTISRTAAVSIMNVLGQEVLRPTSLQWKGQDATIDISKLMAGMYFLEMKTESGVDTKRFVKE